MADNLPLRWSALVASIVLGLIWGFWHLPLFWTKGDIHQEIPLSLFVLQDVALAILITWLYNNTEGSLLVANLFHAGSNTTLGVLPILPMDTGGEFRPLWLRDVFEFHGHKFSEEMVFRLDCGLGFAYWPAKGAVPQIFVGGRGSRGIGFRRSPIRCLLNRCSSRISQSIIGAVLLCVYLLPLPARLR